MKNQPVIDVLTARVSCGQLQEPGPTDAQLDAIQQVALRAADHRQLTPWRFLVIKGDSLKKLGDLFLSSQLLENPALSEEQQQRFKSLPLRAPMIIVTIGTTIADDKVPEIEQTLSAGASVQNMLNAIFALGLGAIWRTGVLAYNNVVKQGLGLQANEKIIGFLYMGTPKANLRTAPKHRVTDYFQPWKGD